MTTHRSAEKRVRQNLKRRARNRSNLSQLRSRVRKLRAAVDQGDASQARQDLPETLAQLDRARRKGVVHRNAAARSKSRLARKVNALLRAQS